MLNTTKHFERPGDLANYISAEAASIRSRVGRTSAASQRIMSSEAAAYERCAVMIARLPSPIHEALTASDVAGAVCLLDAMNGGAS